MSRTRMRRLVTTSPCWADFFREHPIRPVDVRDPLAALNEFGAHADIKADTARLRIGFACLWEQIPQRTWSGSAWNVRVALQLLADTVDIGVYVPRLSRAVLRAIHPRYYGGQLTTTWNYSRLTDAYNARSLRRELVRNPAARQCDVGLVIEDVAALPIPFFTYYDSSWDALISTTESSAAYAASRLISPATMARRRDRQISVYERAAGIITMSHWLARSLVEQSGIPADKVHVAHPGISAGWAPHDSHRDASPVREQRKRKPGRPLQERSAPRRRLLFVGRHYKEFDFYRKGGDLVIAALALLRREYDPQITLTIAGPEKWPLPGSPPDGVRFLGMLPPEEVPALYDSHDLFVMPSRMEPFGVAFVEALGRGLPCIARHAYAMPEIVTPGISGALITNDDEHELAATIAAALADNTLYESCYARAPKIAEYFSWRRTAAEIIQVMTRELQ